MGALKVVEFPKTAEEDVATQVGVIEAALVDAKAGKFSSIMLIAMDHDGTTLTKWTACPDLILLLGHIERMKHAVQRRLDGSIP